MKYLLLTLSMIIVGSISAQTLQSVNANIHLPANTTEMDGVNSLAKTAACGPDTNGYALAKATGLQALNLNNATSATGVSQYFDAPQAITISGVSFYGWKADAVGGTTLNAVVEIYASALDSTPMGMPLATATVVVDTVFGTGTLDVLRKEATFTAPITVSSAYVVVVSNPSANSMSMVFNSWAAADGASEWLASAQIGANWLRSYDVTIGSDLFNSDCLVEPHTTYALVASFLVDDPCFSTGLALNFTNTSSPIVENRMYNVAAYQTIPELSYTWDYGDASPTENVIDGAHTYASAGTYTVTLTDTIYGWTTNCTTDTMVTLGAAPTALFSSFESSLTSTFTDASIVGPGATYLWDFGDGNTSTMMSPTHTYAAAGTYTVCLTVTDGCGTNTVCNVVVVTCTAPTTAYSYIATGLTVDYTNTSTFGTGVMYLWDFGDGSIATTMDATHTYATDGAYTVCLVILDDCGSDSTCQVITVSSCTLPVAGFTISGTSPTFSFTNTSTTTGTATYAWDFGDGNTATTMDASHTYTTNGSFIVSLVVTDSCGGGALDQTVNVTGVGLDELMLVDVSVYPNPSSGVFTIEASAEIETAYITDVSGKLIYTESLNGNEATINAAQFANGTYFLSIRFADDMIQTVRLEVVK